MTTAYPDSAAQCDGTELGHVTAVQRRDVVVDVLQYLR